MYFSAPPDGAARALLEHGVGSQRTIHQQSRRKPTMRPANKMVDVPIKSASASKLSIEPTVQTGVESVAGFQEPSEDIPDGLMGELHLVTQRVDKVIEQFDVACLEPKFKSRTADDPPANPKELKDNINSLFERQENAVSARNFTLANLAEAVATEGMNEEELSAGHGEDPLPSEKATRRNGEGCTSAAPRSGPSGQPRSCTSPGAR